MDALEGRHAQLLAAQHRADASPSASPSPPSSSASASVHDAYVRLLQLKSALVHENHALRTLEAQYQAMEKQVAALARTQLKAKSAAHAALDLKRAHPADLAGFRPLTLATCLAVARAAYREIRAFRANRAACASTGLSFFGWRDRRLLDRRTDSVRFSLEKVFEDAPVEWVADQVWNVLSRPEGVARAYPRNVNARFQVLQHVSEDAVVLYHSLEREGAEDVRVRALILAMRVNASYLEVADENEHADGDADGDADGTRSGPTLILYRGLDPKLFLRPTAEGADGADGDPPGAEKKERRGRVKLEPQIEDVWMDTFVWGVFERAGELGQHCRDDFGGVIQGTALATAGWWMLEILNMALRIEAEVFGPQTSLCG